jgi:hypothetical protein
MDLTGDCIAELARPILNRMASDNHRTGLTQLVVTSPQDGFEDV